MVECQLSQNEKETLVKITEFIKEKKKKRKIKEQKTQLQSERKMRTTYAKPLKHIECFIICANICSKVAKFFKSTC